MNIFYEENYQEKPIKVGEKIHERQEHQSAGNFRQIFSTLQEIRFLLILNSFLYMVFYFGFRTQRSNFWLWNHSKRTSDEGDMNFWRCCYGAAGNWEADRRRWRNFKNSPRTEPAQENSQIWPRCSWDPQDVPVKIWPRKKFGWKKIKILEGGWIQLENQKMKEFLKN